MDKIVCLYEVKADTEADLIMEADLEKICV